MTRGNARWPLGIRQWKSVGQCRLFRALPRIWKGWQFDPATDMAAEVSFYFVLSCFPFLMVLTALLAWLHETSGWYSFSFWLTNYMPTSARDTVLTTMLELSKGSGQFVSFGLLLTIWSASTGFLSLMDSLSKISWRPRRSELSEEAPDRHCGDAGCGGVSSAVLCRMERWSFNSRINLS